MSWSKNSLWKGLRSKEYRLRSSSDCFCIPCIVKVQKIKNSSCLPKSPEQTVQIQIKLSNQDLPCLSLMIPTFLSLSALRVITNILFEKRRRILSVGIRELEFTKCLSD